MPKLTKAFLESRKREVLGRVNDKEYEYHNTRDAELKRKNEDFYYDPRKRIS